LWLLDAIDSWLRVNNSFKLKKNKIKFSSNLTLPDSVIKMIQVLKNLIVNSKMLWVINN
jgi:hypothetical protein